MTFAETFLDQLEARRKLARELDYKMCWHCKYPMIWLEGTEALFEGHIYSRAGYDEVGISGVCEWCFDKMFGEDDYDDDYQT